MPSHSPRWVSYRLEYPLAGGRIWVGYYRRKVRYHKDIDAFKTKCRQALVQANPGADLSQMTGKFRDGIRQKPSGAVDI